MWNSKLSALWIRLRVPVSGTKKKAPGRKLGLVIEVHVLWGQEYGKKIVCGAALQDLILAISCPPLSANNQQAWAGDIREQAGKSLLVSV